MSKETAMINIRGAWVDTRKFINCFADAMKPKYFRCVSGAGRICCG